MSAIEFSMPQTLNMHHSSNFNALFPVKINKMWNLCLKLWFLRNHLSQRLKTYSIGFGMPQTLHMHYSSHFNGFFPVKVNKMWNLCLKLCFFLGTTYHRDSKPVAFDLACLKPYICATQAISMHFFQSKSTKCEIYAWNCDFSWTTYCRDLQQVPLDLAYLKP